MMESRRLSQLHAHILTFYTEYILLHAMLHGWSVILAL